MASASSGTLSRKQSLASTLPHRPIAPPTTLTPENSDAPFEPCAATASFLLYAQQTRILVTHHDTLAIDRRFELHREQVLWIAVDNVSERGSGRSAVSYDAGNTAIVWDIMSGAEMARFSAYEHIQIASFMRNGNIAFGNDQGNIILFEPSTSEHVSARTIFDPITAIAPSADCRTFAIGYLNGSILIATLQPSFTILYTLASTRAPSRITGLSWHGSSSKQKTDMLATQTVDGDLRVWSVPKAPGHEAPTIIRVLQRAEYHSPGPCWFAWSKNGRILQYANGETRSWDVRTKKVTWEVIPTLDGVTGIANYGPGAILFTLTRDHGVQQYDVTPNGRSALVANVKHVPANAPPTPPVMLDERKSAHGRSKSIGTGISLPIMSDMGENSAEEGANRSPMRRIAKEMDSLDALEEELRDVVMPLSPSSSRASSVSSRSSGGRRKGRKYLYDRPDSSRASSTSGQLTEFSLGAPSIKPGHDSVSIRSTSSLRSNSRYRTSSLRNQVVRSPEDETNIAVVDLFPYTRARVEAVPFRAPQYPSRARTPELMQREMLSILFGWNDTARSLIRDELQRQKVWSSAAVILSKWLGDTGSETSSSLFESMAAVDWMLVALNAINPNTSKQLNELFVRRLLEKGDVHSAVGILIGLGENNDAIEIYVAQQYWMEAVLLTCVMFPSDWQRIAHLIRKWGESAMLNGDAEFAVRCFSCTTIDTTEAWFSPRAQDAAYTAQQERLTGPQSAGPPLSPPSRSGSMRLAQKNASLRLITTFGDKGAPVGDSTNEPTPMNTLLVTPIAQSALPYSALSPGGQDRWQQKPRGFRDPSSARTATPGAYKQRPSHESDVGHSDTNIGTPITAARDVPPRLPSAASRRTSSIGSLDTAETTLSLQPPAYDESLDEDLPGPSREAFQKLMLEALPRRNPGDRKPDGLAVRILEAQFAQQNQTPGPTTGTSFVTQSSQASLATPSSARGGRSQSIDDYLVGVNKAREESRERRAQSRHRERSKRRNGSRVGRGTSRPREGSEGPDRDVRYTRAARRSPSSPVPMSPEEIALATQATKAQPDSATSEDESFYTVASSAGLQMDQHLSMPLAAEERVQDAAYEQSAYDMDSRDTRTPSPMGSRLRADRSRGRSSQRQPGSAGRSPSSPLPMRNEPEPPNERAEMNSDGRRNRSRAASRASEAGRSHVEDDRARHTRSLSRKPAPIDDDPDVYPSTAVAESQHEELSVPLTLSAALDGNMRARGLTKALAQKELEDRRLSLARRPSAPSIPLPETLPMRPAMASRANTDNSPTSFTSPLLLRSATVDPDHMFRHGRTTGISTPSAPIGLPSTPRAMRHPRYMSTDPNERDSPPPVPEIPDSMSNMSSLGSSSLSQGFSSNLGSAAPSNVTSNVNSNVASNLTNASYLTSNVSYSSSSALSSQLPSNPENHDQDSAAPLLLPSTVYSQKGSFRAASAPPEKMGGRGIVHSAYKAGLPQSTRRNSHTRKVTSDESQMDKGLAAASINEALATSTEPQVVFLDNDAPPMLPELQHLAIPPPPPPPPPPRPNGLPPNNGSGMISIAIDELDSAPTLLPSTTYPQPMDRLATMSPMERMTTASPSAHRRGPSSVTDGFGSRFRDFGERMRSTSRNRAKSPAEHRSLPYESILPPVPSSHRRRDSNDNRAKSPYEQAMAAQIQAQALPPPLPPLPVPPSTGPDGRLQETSIAPAVLPRSSSAHGYRHPKEVRANMPPQSLQQGTYPGSSSNF